MHLSNENRAPGCLGYSRVKYYPVIYVRMIKTHDQNPYKTASTMESKMAIFRGSFGHLREIVLNFKHITISGTKNIPSVA